MLTQQLAEFVINTREGDVPAEVLRDGGGLLGALVAVPMAAVLGTVGAAVVLVAAVGLGLLVATGTPLARVAAWIVAAWRTLAGHANRFLELEDDPEVEEESEPEPAPKPARTRRATVETIEPVAPEPIPEPVAVIEEPEPEPELIDPEFVDDEPEVREAEPNDTLAQANRVAVPAADRRRVFAWIDLNVPYYHTASSNHIEDIGCRQTYPAALDKTLAAIGA